MLYLRILSFILYGEVWVEEKGFCAGAFSGISKRLCPKIQVFGWHLPRILWLVCCG